MMVMYNDHNGSILKGPFNRYKSINVVHHTSKVEDISHDHFDNYRKEI